MDGSRFDAWTRRRFGLTTGGILAGLLGARSLDDAAAADKQKRRKRRRKRRQRRRNQNPNPNPNPPCTGPDCTTDRPDIILINVDDMRESDYHALPRTRALLAEQGTTYPNFFLTTPLCAPSRASLFRGQYAHNHGVLRNAGAGGGWESFNGSAADEDTVATWLRDAAPPYRTAHVGKHLNGYKSTSGNVGPGWTDWIVPIPVNFFKYTLNVNGAPEPHGDRNRDYLTDVLRNKALNIIRTTPRDTPLFLYFAPKAPHGPSTPARRHVGDFANAPLDRSGSFNEADIADKPAYMQRPLLDDAEIAELRGRNRARLESLLAVDEAIAAIVNALQQTGRLANAYLFFVTDNGFLLGQHRRTAKGVPYEEAIRMSMLARGPGIPAGATNDAIVANTDLAPTIAALAGVDPPDFVDGRSLVPTFDGSGSGRQALLVEFFAGADRDPEEEVSLLADKTAVPPYRAIRTTNRIYVEYPSTAERELYDLDADPFQLRSRHADPAFAAEIADLSAWLATLVDCDGPDCRSAENSPPARTSRSANAAR